MINIVLEAGIDFVAATRFTSPLIVSRALFSIHFGLKRGVCAPAEIN